jgi:flagellar basal body-associated protein FliL
MMQMMNKVLIGIIVLILIAAGAYYFVSTRSTMAPSSPAQQSENNAPSDNQTAAGEFCTPTQLSATMTPEVAAGNAFVTLTIKNTSTTACKIIGNNMPEVEYPTAVENFQTNNKTQPTSDTFTMAPDQTIYSLIHYPNGPQCSSMATDVDTGVSYAISPNESVSFTPTMGSTLEIPSCGNTSEITTIDLYAFSTSTVTPQ